MHGLGGVDYAAAKAADAEAANSNIWISDNADSELPDTAAVF